MYINKLVWFTGGLAALTGQDLQESRCQQLHRLLTINRAIGNRLRQQSPLSS